MTADLLLIADRIGVYVFAISGGIVAKRADMDIFGYIVLAFLPAIGGGTIRDLILDVPVFWLEDTVNLGLAVAGGLTAFFAHALIDRAFKPLRLADAFGMALFAVAGSAKTLSLGHSPGIVLMMGVVTATAGGLIRDVVAREDTLLLKQDIYATAALLASATYLVSITLSLDPLLAYILAIAAGFTLRMLAVRFRWSLPKAPFRDPPTS